MLLRQPTPPQHSPLLAGLGIDLDGLDLGIDLAGLDLGIDEMYEDAMDWISQRILADEGGAGK